MINLLCADCTTFIVAQLHQPYSINKAHGILSTYQVRAYQFAVVMKLKDHCFLVENGYIF